VLTASDVAALAAIDGIELRAVRRFSVEGSPSGLLAGLTVGS
jgi:hypothetical protein